MLIERGVFQRGPSCLNFRFRKASQTTRCSFDVTKTKGLVSALSIVSRANVAWGRINGIPIPTRVMVKFPLKSLTSFDKKGVIRPQRPGGSNPKSCLSCVSRARPRRGQWPACGCATEMDPHLIPLRLPTLAPHFGARLVFAASLRRRLAGRRLLSRSENWSLPCAAAHAPMYFKHFRRLASSLLLDPRRSRRVRPTILPVTSIVFSAFPSM